MLKNLKIAVCQVNFRVGVPRYNASKIIEIYKRYSSEVDLIIFPELAVCGYNCRDLFFEHSFCEEIFLANDEIVAATSDCNCMVIFGTIMQPEDVCEHGEMHNSAVVAMRGKVVDIHHKAALPNYGIFDEKRYFLPGKNGYITPIFINNMKIGLAVCEDIWVATSDCNFGDFDMIISINASPYSITKMQSRVDILKKFYCPLVYVNAIGAQDQLIFDGNSLVIDGNKNHGVIAHLKAFEEDIKIVNFSEDNNKNSAEIQSVVDSQNATRDMYNAIILSIKEYAKYACCSQFVTGLSGGIDSAVTAVLVADALGPENILCVSLPTEFSTQGSIDDAIQLTKNIGCEHIILPITGLKNEALSLLKSVCHNLEDICVTTENIQPRLRMTTLMGIANYRNMLLLCNSNKSESAMGYATIYGDMTGAFAPIIDLYKTQVYELAHYLNSTRKTAVIPENIIKKAPSAELKPDQKDSDTLPEYEILDKILYELIENGQNSQYIAKKLKIDVAEVERISIIVGQNEFKRRQGPIGPKISDRMLTLERRYPICKAK